MSDLGKIEFSGKDVATPPMIYDRIAIGSHGELLLFSLVADAVHVKAVRAILGGGIPASITAAGGKVSRSTDEEWQRPANPGTIYATPDGYACFTHKLGLGACHALFLTRQAGFMKVVSADALWRELNDSRFTTPLLPAWMDHVGAELVGRGFLNEAHCFNARCAVLAMTSDDLDAIVAEGLRGGRIAIPMSTVNA